MSVPAHAATFELKRLAGGISAVAVEVMAEYAQRNDVPPNQRPGQLRMLSAIRQLPITGMVSQLSG